jgi:hypothetical protein
LRASFGPSISPAISSSSLSSCTPRAFLDHLAQEFLGVAVFRVHVGAQRIVHHGLVAATAGFLNLFAEPFQDVIVDTYRDARLSRAGNECPRLLLVKSYSFFICTSAFR